MTDSFISAQDYFKYASVQMASEALFTFNPTPSSGISPSEPGNSQTLRFRGAIDGLILRTGNDRSSKFTAVDAAAFAAKWEVIEHIPNTSTVFSGTLFRDKITLELVLSFRSTEFIDDSTRDNTATNTLEIQETGFAWGQIDDMQTWFADMETRGLITAPLTVTGYSLGGHLATAFNLLHQGEAAPNGDALVKQVYLQRCVH